MCRPGRGKARGPISIIDGADGCRIMETAAQQPAAENGYLMFAHSSSNPGRRLPPVLMEVMEDRHLLSAPPVLDPAVWIKDGAAPLELSGRAAYSAPCVGDWNHDGKKDLVIGQFDAGNIWVFLNKGTDANPSFNGGTLLKVDGQPITTSYG